MVRQIKSPQRECWWYKVNIEEAMQSPKEIRQGARPVLAPPGRERSRDKTVTQMMVACDAASIIANNAGNKREQLSSIFARISASPAS